MPPDVSKRGGQHRYTNLSCYPGVPADRAEALHLSGRVEFVEVESLAGAECRRRNGRGETAIDNGKRASGSLLRIATREGEQIRVTPA